jgi:hypothetical protein
MSHLILLDQGICYDSMTATERGNWLIDQLKVQLNGFSAHLHLNNQNCFFKVIENFVKVTHMEQILEDYRAELERLRQEKERIQQEKERIREEKDKKIAELERRIAELEKKQN